MRRRLVICLLAALGLALVGGGIALLVSRPWVSCRAPDEMCAALAQVEESPDVVAATLDYEVTQDNFLQPDLAQARWQVRIADDVTPMQAGAAAERVARIVRRQDPPSVELQQSIVVVAGKPTERPVEVYPLAVGLERHPAAAVRRAFTLWHAGASGVSGTSVEASDTDGLLALAALAVDRRYLVSLATADGAVRYEGGAAVSLEEVELAVAAARLDGVESVVRTSGRELSIGTSTDDSSQIDEIVRWLHAQDPPDEVPMTYSLWAPASVPQRHGWVGGVRPPPPEPHSVSLPDRVEPWPRDASAPMCSGSDLRVTISAPDAAMGRRFISAGARNISDRPCAVNGVPKVSFFDGRGAMQRDVTRVPGEPGLVPARVVVPVGEEVVATLEWGSMSAADESDETASVRIVAVPGARRVRLVPRWNGAPTTLDVLDGAEVRVDPWGQTPDS